MTVSHYRVLERLGGGGMGVVYKAWDLRLERHAALKFLSPQRSTSDDFKRRFAREARAASRLEHRNICTVFDSDETGDGRLFIAMAFCDGESLKRKIERGRLPLGESVSIAAQVATGLAAAHERGVVHRDVKPGNIMVGADGWVKIVDFGIARLADQTRLTRTGDVMGTTPYVSPEQFVEEEADHRADIWSLGVVLYEMVTGRLPWSASDDRELVNAIVKRPLRPLASLRLDAPQALERVVARALAKRPGDRYQRAEELRADLEEISAEMTPLSSAFERTLIESPQLHASGSRATPAAMPAAAASPPPAAGGAPPSLTEPPAASWAAAAAPAAGVPGLAAAPGAVPAPGAAGSAAFAAAAVPQGLGDDRSTGDGGSVSPASASGGIASWNPLAAADRRPTGGQVGRIVGHYRILAPLGGGGMGVVYKAQDLALERVVALKFLPPELTRDPEAKTRFLQEARAASALDHPNICTIYEVAESDDGQLYLAMACYEGETLKQRLQRGRLPIEEAVETAQQVARGLVKAHRHGIVHRDIKPANVMVTTDEIVKILDFGIAKLLGAAGLTRMGSSLGTPSYMSPEQARGEEVDPRTDVWSLGAILYEMATGRRPFRGEHEQAVFYALFNEEPEPVLQLRPDAPPELARIIGRMLAKDPDQRYATAAAALSDLRALYGPVTGTLTGLTGSTSTALNPAAAPPPPAKRRSWWLLGAAAAALLALVGLFLLLRQHAPPPPEATQASYLQLTNFDGKATTPSLAPEGGFFVYARSLHGRSHLFLQRVEGENPADLSPSLADDDSQPAISPDGQQIAFRSERDGGGIYVMGLTGESAHRLTNFGYNPAWSPDGGELVLATEGVGDPMQRHGLGQLWRIKLTGGEPRRVDTAGDAAQPAWSPKGLRIAYWGRETGTSNRGLWTVPAAGGAPVQVLKDASLNWDPVWAPDGRYLYYASNRSGPINFWRIPIDESTGAPTGDAEPATTPSQSSAFLSFSQDGKRFTYASNEDRSNVESVALALGDTVTPPPVPVQVLSVTRPISTIDLSPDGKWIAYSTLSPGEQIYLVRTDGSDTRRLTNDTHRYRVPRWSPDGKELAFYSDRDGAWRAWRIGADGSHLELLCETPLVFDPLWSPDQKTLACDVGDNQPLSLIDLRLPLAARRPIMVLPAGHSLEPGGWSSDGRRIAGNSDSNRQDIVVYSLANRSLSPVLDHGQPIGWLHDNRNILYIRDGSIRIVDADSKASRLLLAPPAGSKYSYAVASPADQMLYALRAVAAGDIWLGKRK